MNTALERDQDRQQLITRRSLMLLAGQSVAALVLLGRAGELQLVKGAAYNLLSEENRISIRIVPPPRGQLLDRKGNPLAVNQQSYRAVILREEVKDLEAVLNRFADVVDLSPEDRGRIQKELHRGKNFMPVVLKSNLSWNEMSRLEILTPELPGVSVDSAAQRFYPLGAAAAHVLGYLGVPDESEIENDNEALMGVSGFQIGKTGAEQTYDNILRGQAGGLQLEVNAKGRVVQELKRTPPVPGKNLQLTLDADLQQAMYQRLSQERSAAAVVMDVHNGAIYAMGSSPAFDPNIFTQTIPQDLWQQLNADPTKPMLNKVFGGTYPPGSTFKMATALAALEAGVITPETTVFCSGSTTLGTHVFHCWKKGGHGTVALTQAIAQSCDCFFYETARRAGIERVSQTAHALGLGQVSGLGLSGERHGLIPDRAWKRRVFKQDWTVADSYICGIGQGYVTASILQLAIMTARLSNGGTNVKPTLLVDEAARASAPSLGFNPANLAAIAVGMKAVTSPGGTAAAEQIPEVQWHMAGKTGTAQVQAITQAQRDAGFDVFKLPWEQRHHALFIAYAPEDRPQYALATIIQHGGAGGSVAGPLGRDILRKTQELDPAKNFKPA